MYLMLVGCKGHEIWAERVQDIYIFNVSREQRVQDMGTKGKRHYIFNVNRVQWAQDMGTMVERNSMYSECPLVSSHEIP